MKSISVIKPIESKRLLWSCHERQTLQVFRIIASELMLCCLDSLRNAAKHADLNILSYSNSYVKATKNGSEK